MAQIGLFEFPGVVAMFGRNRKQAAALLEEVERKVTREFPAVAFVQFSRSHDRAMLARYGIDVDGEPAGESIRVKTRPAQAELDDLLASWLQQKDREREEQLQSYAEERKQQNDENARRRAARGRE